MKKYINISYLLASLFILLTACSEEIFSPTTLGDNVTLSLSYSDVSPKEITVNTRATEAEERKLDNLYIYIFDANGKLKGFKAITEGLDQNTSDSHRAEVTGIKTRAGESYIYAVANIETGLYPVAKSTGTIENGKLPIGLDEDKAQAGEYNFTLDQLKALTFKRNNSDEIQISSRFLMSGAVKDGNLVNITEGGVVDGNDNAIKLRRIVSKVKFTIMAASGDNRKFTLSTYDIRNIAIDGGLIAKEDGNTNIASPSSNNYSDITGITLSVGEVDQTTGTASFEFYLPENLQKAKNSVSNWNAREDDNQSNPKVFTNAPEKGTYLVLNGKYEESKNGVNRTADVTYYVHLGDCSSDLDNYDVERNCKYTFNITVAGVDKIIVEAKKEGNEQPGAEGVVMEYGKAGKTLVLDSHYDYMVMRFYQKDILELKKDGKGYYYQVYALGNHTDPMNVTGDNVTGSINGVDTSWIEFAIGGNYKEGAKGTACSYPGTNNKDLYSIENFLKLLYNNAENNSFWTITDNGNKCIDATCFVNENYYSNLSWNQYVNDVPKRAFYVANAVDVSEDGRSVYATTQYGLQQYNIQTFYDRDKAGYIVAYGCETINDEEGKNYTVNGKGNTYESKGSNSWDGRSNMLQDVSVGKTWSSLNLDSDLSLIKACMSRNRDLNGNGVIDKEEVRWYAPAIDQYAGLWIGEQVLSTEAKLYNKDLNALKAGDEVTGRMLYYASTKGTNTFFSEEGMATNNYNRNGANVYPPKYVRCVRNLQSNAEGYDKTPNKYYSFDNTTRLVTLDNVDKKALNNTGEQGELNSHNEREEGNKPASKFYIASNTYPSNNNITQEQVVEGTVQCYRNYTESGKTWRVPNQREMCLMFMIDKQYINNTYCRTKFSNENFRKSWTYAGGVLTMSDNWNNNGYIRCVSVTK